MLDSPSTYTKYDTTDIMYGLDHLPEQVSLAWHDTRDLKLPASYRGCANIVLAGMGGSALGTDMIRGVFFNNLKTPLEIVRGYELPAYASGQSLVILSSFSGTTEEVLSAAEVAKKRRAKIVVIATGGALVNWAKKQKVPAYVFTPGDLAKQPRLGVGFSMLGVAGILERAGLLKIQDHQVAKMIRAMGEVIDSSAVDVPEKNNPAKKVARSLVGRSILLIGAGHLFGNAHVLANQINETAKQLALPVEIPEINHHLLEGLTFPKKNIGSTTALMLRSELYHPRIQKRFAITADLLERQGLTVIDYQAGGGSLLEECGEMLEFGSYLSYYLAMLNKVQPSAIPFVDEFKKRLSA
jgi:glucose/mannose-6-phosphate isomerase